MGMLSVTLLWELVAASWIFIGGSQARGSNPAVRYRAIRYGNYYSTVYFSYSGGKGYARYSRVYAHHRNLYPDLYNHMFQWFKTDQFKVYKNTPSGSISVCKNYEANENGTYLGIFTCPLPFVPEDHTYCCGFTNAQYCCKFWDLPLNLAAATLGIIMGLVLVITIIYIIVQLCINRHKHNKSLRRRKAVRRIGMLRRRGRMASSGSLWALALFSRVHAESNYSENTTADDEDDNDEEDCEFRSKIIAGNIIDKMKNLAIKNSNSNGVTFVTAFEGEPGNILKEADKTVSSIAKENDISMSNGKIEGETGHKFTDADKTLSSIAKEKDISMRNGKLEGETRNKFRDADKTVSFIAKENDISMRNGKIEGEPGNKFRDSDKTISSIAKENDISMRNGKLEGETGNKFRDADKTVSSIAKEKDISMTNGKIKGVTGNKLAEADETISSIVKEKDISMRNGKIDVEIGNTFRDADKTISSIAKEKDISKVNGKIEEMSFSETETKAGKGVMNKAFLHSFDEQRRFDDVIRSEYQLKPLRKKPRVKCNEYNKTEQKFG